MRGIQKRWLILLVSCLVNLCIGSLYSWSVLSGPMTVYLSELNNQSGMNLSIVFTVANSIGPVTMISGGYINDRFGPRWILLAGAAFFGGGMIGASYAQSVWTLLLTYGLGVGLGMGMVYGITVSNTIKFFPDKRGLVGGLTTACYGGSSIIIPPIANLLIQNFHVTTAFRVIGFISLCLISLSSFIIESCPTSILTSSNLESKNPAVIKEFDYQEMIKDAIFPVMLLILLCGAFSGLMFISQIATIAQELMNFSTSEAALSVSLLALFNTLGRVGTGMLSDKIGILNTLKVTFSMLTAASLCLYFSNPEAALLFYFGLSVIGFCFGGIMGIYPAFTAVQFGTKNNSVNYGIMFIGFALAGILGPSVLSEIYKVFGIYQPAFLISFLLSILGLGLVYVFNRMVTVRIKKKRIISNSESS